MTSEDYTYMEDFTVGQTFISGPIRMTEAEIIAYAQKFDPQIFHTDPARAKDSAFGMLVASGWHTASVTMRLIVEAAPKMKGGMIGRNVVSMNWPRPVLPGDELSYEGEILEMRASSSHPTRGIMRMRNTTRNQKGETVLEMETVVFVPRRG